jgi:hypothetical protein
MGLKKMLGRRAKNTPLAFFTRYKIQRVAGDSLTFLQYPACVCRAAMAPALLATQGSNSMKLSTRSPSPRAGRRRSVERPGRTGAPDRYFANIEIARHGSRTSPGNTVETPPPPGSKRDPSRRRHETTVALESRTPPNIPLTGHPSPISTQFRKDFCIVRITDALTAPSATLSLRLRTRRGMHLDA